VKNITLTLQKNDYPFYFKGIEYWEWLKLKKKVSKDIEFFFGKHELIISKKYNFYYMLNDFLLSIWFLVGSILFFWETTHFLGTCFFVIGSLQLLIRPIIQISRDIHLKRLNESTVQEEDKTNN